MNSVVLLDFTNCFFFHYLITLFYLLAGTHLAKTSLSSVENFCGLECGFYLNRVHFCGLENFCGLEWASTRMRAKTVYRALQFSEKTRAVFVNCFECDSGVLCEPSRHSKDLSSARDRRAILVSFQVLKGPEPSRGAGQGGVSSPSAALLLGPQVAQNATLAHHSFLRNAPQK